MIYIRSFKIWLYTKIEWGRKYSVSSSIENLNYYLWSEPMFSIVYINIKQTHLVLSKLIKTNMEIKIY
jgi:hypothetical protein